MKVNFIAAELCLVAFAMGCGSQGPKDKEVSSPSAIPLTAVEAAVIERPDNLMNCQTIHSDSVLCSFNPNVTVSADESTLPTLVTLQYTLKCSGEKDEALSRIAFKTDAQVRRLQYNVEDRKISLLSRSGANVDLAKVLKDEQTAALLGESNCWYLKVDVVAKEVFATALEGEDASQQADQENSSTVK